MFGNPSEYTRISWNCQLDGAINIIPAICEHSCVLGVPPLLRFEADTGVFPQLPLVTALCGGHLTIPQFGSRPAMQVPITPGIQVGSVMMIPGHGMPNPNGAPGDLKVCLKIVMPRNLSSEQMEQLRATLGPP